jgi:lipopolysaccharide export system permease protein
LTLFRYMMRKFFASVLAVASVIGLVILLFASAENLRRLADREAGIGDILAISILQVPEVLYQAFALVMMLASLVTFLALARSSELVVLRAAGISALRLIAIPMIGALVLGVMFFMLVNPAVSVATRAAADMEEPFRSSSYSRLSVSSEGLWLRQADEGGGQTVIQAARATPDASILWQVRLHRFDADGALVSRIEAPSAQLTPGSWLIVGANRWDLGLNQAFEQTAVFAEIRLPTELTREQIIDSFAPPQMLSFWDLTPFIRQLEASGFSALRHRLFFESELAKPVFFAAMVLIGAAFSLRPNRFGQTGVMILFAILAGFSLYFIKDLAETMGANGEIPLHVAAWTPAVSAILMALGLLLHLEDG